MYPLIAQTDVFSAEFINQVGVPSFIAIIVTIIGLLIARAFTHREKTDAETQSTVTQLIPTFASQIGELQSETNRLHLQIGNLKDDIASEREKRIVIEKEHERYKDVSDLKIQQLDNTVKQHERKIAIL